MVSGVRGRFCGVYEHAIVETIAYHTS